MIDENKVLEEIKTKLNDYKPKYFNALSAKDRSEEKYYIGYIHALFEVEELIKELRGDSDDD